MGMLGDLLGLDGHLTKGLDSLRRARDVVTILDDKLNPIPVLVESLELTPHARQMTLKPRTAIQSHTDPHAMTTQFDGGALEIALRPP